ncbi:hypothetical protein NMG60_11006002 [Bertholletia excelsa]
MSWFGRSIANSLRLDDDQSPDGHNVDDSPKNTNSRGEQNQQSESSSPSAPERGVKEDISELTKTLTRQFWGVASFLAPPPQISNASSTEVSLSAEASDPEASDAAGIAGIRSDFAEIGGKFRSGISKLSNNMAVSEFTKIASNFLQLGSEQEEFGSAEAAVGVTDEVVAFVRDIAMHPETWLDFPLPDDEDDDDDLDMSDAQQEHALAVERLAPRLAALRIELCPGCMSESCFWKIYFVLLHPRLNKHDAELLTTPQIVKARALLTQELQNRTMAKAEKEWSARDMSYSNDTLNVPHEKSSYVPSNNQSESVPLVTSAIGSATSVVDTDIETEKHSIHSTEIPIIDKAVIEEPPVHLFKNRSLHPDTSSEVLKENYEDEADDWLKEESSEGAGAGGITIPIDNEEDVSFSDLEDDDGDAPTSYSKVTSGSDSSTKSRDWVQLTRSSADLTKPDNVVSVDRAGSGQLSGHNPEKESNDWLDIEDIDVE